MSQSTRRGEFILTILFHKLRSLPLVFAHGPSYRHGVGAIVAATTTAVDARMSDAFDFRSIHVAHQSLLLFFVSFPSNSFHTSFTWYDYFLLLLLWLWASSYVLFILHSYAQHTKRKAQSTIPISMTLFVDCREPRRVSTVAVQHTPTHRLHTDVEGFIIFIATKIRTASFMFSLFCFFSLFIFWNVSYSCYIASAWCGTCVVCASVNGICRLICAIYTEWMGVVRSVDLLSCGSKSALTALTASLCCEKKQTAANMLGGAGCHFAKAKE